MNKENQARADGSGPSVERQSENASKLSMKLALRDFEAILQKTEAVMVLLGEKAALYHEMTGVNRNFSPPPFLGNVSRGHSYLAWEQARELDAAFQMLKSLHDDMPAYSKKGGVR